MSIGELSFESYYTRFKKACSRHRLKVTRLSNGSYTATKLCKRGPRLAIMAGLHGDERSGPMAILKWLEQGKLPKRCSVWICPLINDHGWDKNTRRWHRFDLNNRFFDDRNNPAFIPQIMRSLKKFKPTTFVDLHEDITTNYPYLFRNIRTESDFVISLQKKLKIKFEPWKYDWEYPGASENHARDIGCLNTTTVEAPHIWTMKKKIAYHVNVIRAVNNLVLC